MEKPRSLRGNGPSAAAICSLYFAFLFDCQRRTRVASLLRFSFYTDSLKPVLALSFAHLPLPVVSIFLTLLIFSSTRRIRALFIFRLFAFLCRRLICRRVVFLVFILIICRVKTTAFKDDPNRVKDSLHFFFAELAFFYRFVAYLLCHVELIPTFNTSVCIDRH